MTAEGLVIAAKYIVSLRPNTLSLRARPAIHGSRSESGMTAEGLVIAAKYFVIAGLTQYC